MRALILLAVMLFGGAAGATAQTYANSDSITAHGLVFIGATDRYEYSYTDTVRISYRVANRSAQAESLWVTEQCTATLTQETWCDTLGTCEEEPETLRTCYAPVPPAPWIEVFPPGERVIAELIVPTRFVIGSQLRFQIARAHFFNPWDTSPYFHFAISYARRPLATAVATQSWGAFKSLYR